MQPTLVILAAGLGSRYGRLKQMEAVGPHGEAIIDYSVYDALKSGFGKVVFIIKRDMETSFRENLMARFEKQIEVDYVLQELDMLPQGFALPPDRVKPWGTAHAVMVAESSVKEPFSVINADDFYGFEAFEIMQEFLSSDRKETDYGLVGYKLGNTLSEHGTVSRGTCEIDSDGYLQSVTERTKIGWEENNIVSYEDGATVALPDDTTVSMNMWGFSPVVFDQIKEGFRNFLDEKGDDPKAEYYIPTMVDQMIREDRARVKVLPCDASWFGITYREDLEKVRASIREKIEAGEYPSNLWA